MTIEARERVQLGRIEVLDPRSVWVNEAHDFTPWLLENADALADALGLDIELTAAEHPVGPFFLDLIGRDLTNDRVLIVENQLTPTDHTHLGQLITYAANLDAGTVVWMAPQFREEHRQALSFLNDLGADQVSFFGVEIAVARIGESVPAPLFRLAAEPNEFHSQASSAARVTSQDLSGKPALYAAFWERFLERVRTERPGWTRARKVRGDNAIWMPSRFREMTAYVAGFSSHGLRYELYVDSTNPEAAESIYRSLEAHKQEIEESFGAGLSWEEIPGRRARRIAAYTPGDVSEVDSHERFIDWLIATGARLRAALDPYA